MTIPLANNAASKLLFAVLLCLQCFALLVLLCCVLCAGCLRVAWEKGLPGQVWLPCGRRFRHFPTRYSCV